MRAAVSSILILALLMSGVLRWPVAVIVALGIAAIIAVAVPPRASPGPALRDHPLPVGEGTVITALAADVRDIAPDLQNVLAGILADEGGKLVSSNGSMLALFKGRGHAAAAVHAAQRILSNVDAVHRRLEREVRVTIGVDTAAEADVAAAAIAVAQMTRARRHSVLIGAAAVAKLGSATAAVTSIDDQDRLFTFAPVQQTLF